MTEKHFDAILAKNYIARAIKGDPAYISVEYIMERLKEIEAYIGQGNQPSVADTFASEYY